MNAAAIGAELEAFDDAALPLGAAPILIALSGGGDSIALMHALRARLPPARLIAAIVDHALRPGSEETARKAAAAARAAGIEAHILTLDWPEGPRRAQSILRERRYAALCALARRIDAPAIALGHTADDQAETVLMRAARGADWRGLAAMAPRAPAPLWPQGEGVTLVRPLLRARRAALRRFLRAIGESWSEDPANENAEYERVRARTRLSALEAAGFDPMRLAALAARLRPIADAVDAAAAAWLVAHVDLDGPVARLSPAALAPSDPATAGLRALIAAVSGQARPIGAAEAARFAERLAASAFRGATLGGVQARPEGGAIRLDRDPGALSGRADAAGLRAVPLPPGETIVWDGRLALTAAEPFWSAEPPEPGQGAAPVLTRSAGRERVSFAEALKTGLVAAEWRLKAHLAHLLPAFTSP